MLENSKDILNWALSISAVMVAVLFSWLLYQIGRVIKSTNDTIKSVQKIVNGVDETLEKFKSKAGNFGAFLTVFVKSAQEVLKVVSQRKAKNKKQK